MPVKLRLALLIAAAGLTAFTLWPAFAVGTFILIPVLVVFLAAGTWLTAMAYRTRSRWPLFGLLGGVPGLLAGGIAFVRIAQAIGREDDDGIESLIVVSAGIGGAYIGALAGAAVGIAIGLLVEKTRRAKAGH